MGLFPPLSSMLFLFLKQLYLLISIIYSRMVSCEWILLLWILGIVSLLSNYTSLLFPYKSLRLFSLSMGECGGLRLGKSDVVHGCWIQLTTYTKIFHGSKHLYRWLPWLYALHNPQFFLLLQSTIPEAYVHRTTLSSWKIQNCNKSSDRIWLLLQNYHNSSK